MKTPHIEFDLTSEHSPLTLEEKKRRKKHFKKSSFFPQWTTGQPPTPSPPLLVDYPLMYAVHYMRSDIHLEMKYPYIRF